MTKNQETSTITHAADQLDVDENSFSDLGASIETDFTTLSSSVRDHVYENGRRYHSLNAGTYNLPNDESEQERLDMMHHAHGLMLGGELHQVECPKPLGRVLDVGTGTGIWAIDMADLHPEATVIGVDLSPIQPSWVPPNCVFEVDDITKPWMWKEPFDFIHSRDIGQGIRDWPEYMKRIYDNLSPGGVVQLNEVSMRFYTDDDTIGKGGRLEEYQEKLHKALGLMGMRDDTPSLESYVQKAGFEEIQVSLKKMPLGPWAKEPAKKELGKWGLAIAEQGLKSHGIAVFTRQLGLSSEEAIEICDGAFSEFCSRKVHTYSLSYHISGKKPKEVLN